MLGERASPWNRRYSESVFVTIRLHADSHDDIAAFEEAVQGIDEVVECYAVAGQLDFLLHVVAQDTPHYERIRDRLARLPGIERLDSSFTMHTVVKRTTLPSPPGSFHADRPPALGPTPP